MASWTLNIRTGWDELQDLFPAKPLWDSVKYHTRDVRSFTSLQNLSCIEIHKLLSRLHKYTSSITQISSMDAKSSLGRKKLEFLKDKRWSWEKEHPLFPGTSPGSTFPAGPWDTLGTWRRSQLCSWELFWGTQNPSERSVVFVLLFGAEWGESRSSLLPAWSSEPGAGAVSEQSDWHTSAESFLFGWFHCRTTHGPALGASPCQGDSPEEELEVVSLLFGKLQLPCN